MPSSTSPMSRNRRSPDLAEEDDRDVVDAGPAVGWRGRDLAADGPEDAQRDLVDGEAVAGGEPRPDRRARSRQRRAATPRSPAPARSSPARRPGRRW